MRALAVVTALLLLAFAAPTGAVHFYRNGGGGCTPAEGALGSSPAADGAQVWLLHNTFLDLRTGLPVTVIQAGQSVTWSWASAHCHSRNAARLALGVPPLSPPRTTAIGALAHYVSHADPAHYNPTNITFGIMPALESAPKSRHDRNLALSARALADLDRWLAEATASV
jgi:hypothetical protein